MALASIQKGDRVKVISGNYRGTVGLVSQVVKKKLPRGGTRTRVAVSEIPQIVDYRRNLKMYNMPGEMRLKDRFVDVSNVQLLTDSEEVSRTKTEVRDGQKVRVLKKNNQVVTKNSLVTEAEAGTKTAKKSDKAKTTKKSTTKAKK